ncbi:MAG: site-2 protease family protein [Nitrososphaerota archaeon]|nr:site-2 protease family protein [Candidatus Calditenuaceae archaeon]MDW8072817.1 site-2 protease family protein [Nitrososphaerota archaeon]
MIGPEAYGDKLEAISSIVRTNLPIREVVYVEGVLTFRVMTKEIKESFKSIFSELVRIGYVPVAQEVGGEVLLKVFPYNPPQRRKSYWPLLLFVVTVITVFVDGLIRSGGLGSLLGGGAQFGGRFWEAVAYTVGVLSIIGIHELGHKISAKQDQIDASLPYFIPGVPGVLPTFGAIIFQRGPIRNRDDLFDLGVSGPIAGFLASIVVMVFAFQQAEWVERSVVEDMVRRGAASYLPSPLIFNFANIAFSRGDGLVPLFPAVGFAAWLGMVVTSLNLLPVWQLDGGRIFRSLTSFRRYRLLSFISVGILFVTGYYYLSLLLLLFLMTPIDFAPLDMVSPLSKFRKISFVGVILMMVVTFVILPGPLLSLIGSLIGS